MFKILFRIVSTVTVFTFVLGIPHDTLFTSSIKKLKPTNILNYAGKTYYFGNVFKANFYSAFQFCRQQGMQLLSITNKAENDRLFKFATEIGLKNEHFWTSGTNLVDSKQYIWLSTGSAIVYNNWYTSEPTGLSGDGNNYVENCVEVAREQLNGIETFYWNDRYCHDHLNFICEKYDNES